MLYGSRTRYGLRFNYIGINTFYELSDHLRIIISKEANIKEEVFYLSLVVMLGAWKKETPMNNNH